MTQGSYKQFCPVAMASEVLCTRWTILVLREMLMGSTRFNDLRRGLARMSPALLSQRLKDLEEAGVVRRVATANDPSVHEYHLTQAGKELLPLIEGLGSWGHRWVESEVSLQHLDESEQPTPDGHILRVVTDAPQSPIEYFGRCRLRALIEHLEDPNRAARVGPTVHGLAAARRTLMQPRPVPAASMPVGGGRAPGLSGGRAGEAGARRSARAGMR